MKLNQTKVIRDILCYFRISTRRRGFYLLSPNSHINSRASQYKRNSNVAFPPFSFVIAFIQEMCDLKNDPGLRVNHTTQVEKNNTRVLTRDSHVEEENSSPKTQNNRCPIHKASHSLDECRTFRDMTLDKRRETVMHYKLCLRCFKGQHKANKCKLIVKCETCGSRYHKSIMHDNDWKSKLDRQDHGGEITPLTRSQTMHNLCNNFAEKLK
jgi:hypothetical protein